MSVYIVVSDDSQISATVTGDFDFAASRELLLGVRRQWGAGAQEVVVHLHRVTRTSSCAIGAMLLLAEMAGEGFHVRVEHCAGEVIGLFGSGLLDRYFSDDTMAECRACLAKCEPGCQRLGNTQELLAI